MPAFLLLLLPLLLLHLFVPRRLGLNVLLVALLFTLFTLALLGLAGRLLLSLGLHHGKLASGHNNLRSLYICVLNICLHRQYGTEIKH